MKKTTTTPDRVLMHPDLSIADTPNLIDEALTSVLIAQDVLAERAPLDPGEWAAWYSEMRPLLRELRAWVEQLDTNLWLTQFQGTRNAAFLKHADLVAEMLRQYHANPSAATTFWIAVFRQHEPVTHVTWVLAETFRMWPLRPKTRWPRPYAAKAAKAWETFLKEAL